MAKAGVNNLFMRFVSEKLPTIDLDMQRCVSTHKCVFRSCTVKRNLQNITPAVRFKILQNHRFYIPHGSRACEVHFKSKSWKNTNNFRSVNRFNARHIENMIDLLRSQNLLKDNVIRESTSVDMKIATGLSREQFKELFRSIPSLAGKFKNKKSVAEMALYTYLMRLRTGQTISQISSHLKVGTWKICDWLKIVRNVLSEEFVPPNVQPNWSREDLIRNTTDLSRAIYGNGKPDQIVVVFDGTYLYVDNSGNQTFQKQTYTDQKKRNFVKIMMCVTTNGKIIFTSGPHPAVDNDATIMSKILNHDVYQLFSVLQAGDVCLVDRGFRDCVEILRSKGLDVRMPEMITKNPDGTSKKQLSTQQANNSRLVTKCRYVVETRNGHMKCVWRLFKMVWCTKSLQHLMKDWEIGAALLNKFFSDLISDKQVPVDVASRMCEKLNEPNRVAEIIRKSSFQKHMKEFRELENFNFFPELTKDDLFVIALGVYQMAQAQNYCTRHLTMNAGQFKCFSLPQNACMQFFSNFASPHSELHILLTQLLSRHQSKKNYKTFLLIDANKKGHEAILGFFCECKNGNRTVGCCSHTMCMIWYLGFARRNGPIHKVAGFLDTFFEGWTHSTSDEENSE